MAIGADNPPAEKTPSGEIPEPTERGGGLPDVLPEDVAPPPPPEGPEAPPVEPTPAEPKPSEPPPVEVQVPDFLKAAAAPAPEIAPAPAPPPPPPAVPAAQVGFGIFTREELLEAGRAVYGDPPQDATPEESAAHDAACLREGQRQERMTVVAAARTARALQQGDREAAARTAEEETVVKGRRDRNALALRDEFYRLTPELAHLRDQPAERTLLAVAASCLTEAGVGELADLTGPQFAAVLPIIRTDALAAFGLGAFRAPTVPPGAQPAKVEATGAVVQRTPGFAEQPGGATVPANLAVTRTVDPDLAAFDADQLRGRPDLQEALKRGS
jgi:hypothetical protein